MKIIPATFLNGVFGWLSLCDGFVVALAVMVNGDLAVSLFGIEAVGEVVHGVVYP